MVIYDVLFLLQSNNDFLLFPQNHIQIAQEIGNQKTFLIFIFGRGSKIVHMTHKTWTPSNKFRIM